MLLAIDVGNTNTVVGVYYKNAFQYHWRLETKKERTADEWGIFLRELLSFENIQFDKITGVVISNVVPPLQRALTEMSEKYIKRTPVSVGPDIKIDMPIDLDNPAEIGADRIVNAVAAYHRYKTDLIIVDFGTATTFDYVTSDGEYRGGLIIPGMGISLEALFQKASKLPRVEIIKPKRVIGKSTIESMQSGIYHGYIGMIDSVVRKMEKEIGRKAKVIATGGLSVLIAEGSETIEETDEFLTLDGLRLIYEWNNPG